MEFLQFVAISSPHIFLSISLLFNAFCWAQFDINGNSFCSVVIVSALLAWFLLCCHSSCSVVIVSGLLSFNSTVFKLQEIENLLWSFVVCWSLLYLSEGPVLDSDVRKIRVVVQMFRNWDKKIRCDIVIYSVNAAFCWLLKKYFFVSVSFASIQGLKK